MPIIITLIGVFILVLTAYIIVHPSPMFENGWELYSWKGTHVEDFLRPFEKSPRITFALGETREHIILTPEDTSIEPMQFDLDDIGWSEVHSHTKHNNLSFYLSYDIEPYEHCKLVVKLDDIKEPVAELIFVSTGLLSTGF
jgi:hypothetical protein